MGWEWQESSITARRIRPWRLDRLIRSRGILTSTPPLRAISVELMASRSPGAGCCAGRVRFRLNWRSAMRRGNAGFSGPVWLRSWRWELLFCLWADSEPAKPAPIPGGTPWGCRRTVGERGVVVTGWPSAGRALHAPAMVAGSRALLSCSAVIPSSSRRSAHSSRTVRPVATDSLAILLAWS